MSPLLFISTITTRVHTNIIFYPDYYISLSLVPLCHLLFFLNPFSAQQPEQSCVKCCWLVVYQISCLLDKQVQMSRELHIDFGILYTSWSGKPVSLCRLIREEIHYLTLGALHCLIVGDIRRTQQRRLRSSQRRAWKTRRVWCPGSQVKKRYQRRKSSTV